jgi:hypothetical protein
MSDNRKPGNANTEAFDAPSNITPQPTGRVTNQPPHPDPTVTPEEAYMTEDKDPPYDPDAPVPNRSAYVWGAVIVVAIITLYLVLR